MSIFKKNYGLLFLLGYFLISSAYAQFNIPKKPAKETSIYDYANILSASQKTALEQKLINYADSTSTQIVIATTPTINGENIGMLTPKWAHQWGIGQAEKDNGVFILLAEKERKIWITPGYGLEQKLTAGINGEIVRNIIIPEFKKGDYYSGLDKGTDAIIQLFNGTYQETRQLKETNSNGGSIFLLLFIVFVIIIIIIFRNRGDRSDGNRGNRNGGFDLMDMIILSNLGRSGGSFGGGSSGGSFGGGGFGGGFGGGGFSGGGAGGSW